MIYGRGLRLDVLPGTASEALFGRPRWR